MSVVTRSICLVCLALLGGWLVAPSVAEEPDQSASQILAAFETGWDDSSWIIPHRFAPSGHMRAIDNDHWKLRMRTLPRRAQLGQSASPALLDALQSRHAYMQNLAAQGFGYVDVGFDDRERVAEALLARAQHDENATVRLYAVDSLGMLGLLARQPLERLMRDEQNRDVKMHIQYALDRGDKRIDAAVIERLKAWDAKKIDSARVGKLAPDFELPSLNGPAVRLSGFRGKKSVVLVFIYGDT